MPTPLVTSLLRRRRAARTYTLSGLPGTVAVGQAGILVVSPYPPGSSLFATITVGSVTNGSAMPTTLTMSGIGSQVTMVTPAAAGAVSVPTTNNAALPNPSPATTTGYAPVVAIGDGGFSGCLVAGAVLMSGGLSVASGAVYVGGSAGNLPVNTDVLLLETGDHLLLETGDKILIG